MHKPINAEKARLKQNLEEPVGLFDKWGPYVSERAWGSVREDYSPDGDAWRYFPFDEAHRKAYRWGEDGIAGICDRYQVLVFAPAFWNGKDPILKERLFGLNSPEGNHGEDVKEYYYHLDALPSHAYLKYLYKYPHGEFPYQKLKEENQKRGLTESEYELVDTGIFEKNRYFDIVIEYGKVDAEDLVIKIEAFNRGDVAAPLHVIPHLWFRNQWSWTDEEKRRPKIEAGAAEKDYELLIADDALMASPQSLNFDYHLGKRFLYGSSGGRAFFTDNDTRVLAQEKKGSFYKDAFHEKIIRGLESVNPYNMGTKACLHYFFPEVKPGSSEVVYLRLSPKELKHPLHDIEKVLEERRREADIFYESVHPEKATPEEKMIQRQALSGMIWNKQIYLFDVHRWLKGDSVKNPPPEARWHGRNIHWHHLNSMRIMMMPDKWEYPWFAAWDHAFHCLTMALVDIDFAKEQFWLPLFDQFQHPNGQIPSYEWEFSDLNPPVQGWALFHLYQLEKRKTGKGDRDFLEKCFHKLLMNFSWWVNKVDSEGNNVFEGGFLGMDNISVLDRSVKLEGGIKLQQSDGTGWMAIFCLSLMRIALELSRENPTYEALATKFFEHYVYIGHAMKQMGNRDYELWSEKDGFFYDVLTYPDGKFEKFRVRSLVGIIPFYATELLSEEEINLFPEFKNNFMWFLQHRQDLVEKCIIPMQKDGMTYYALTLMNAKQLSSVLGYIWNPEEFKAEFGVRSLSKYHEKNPFSFQSRQIGYEPAESTEKIKGGNSNWRGPVWMPTNYLLIETLAKLSRGAHPDFKVNAPGDAPVNLQEMSRTLAQKILLIFKKDPSGRRPFFGKEFPFAEDPHWQDFLFFYEYYHPETGKGLGASHQTGWSALVANLIDELYS